MSARRLSQAGLRRLEQQLSERDLAIVARVDQLRLLSGRQIEQLHFPSVEFATPETAARICRGVLHRLVDLKLIHRLERQVGGIHAGSSAYLYTLGHIGKRILETDGTRRRVCEPGLAFVEHQLAISQLAVELVLVSRAGAIEDLQFQGEPTCWRTIPDLGHSIVRPDLHVSLAVGELELRWFIEVDTGTHALTAITRKARLYQRYYQSGVEQATYGVFPRVAWITPSSKRVNQLAHTLQADEFTQGLFVTGTSEQAIALLRGDQP